MVGSAGGGDTPISGHPGAASVNPPPMRRGSFRRHAEPSLEFIMLSTIASVRGRTKAPGDHGSAIAFWFIVLVLICLAAFISLLGPQEMWPGSI
jgi:hypothetical protein